MLLPVIEGEEFPERMTQPRIQRMIPVADDEDDVGMESLPDVSPTDSVVTEHIIVEVFDLEESSRHYAAKRLLDPSPR